ncbi:MAG: acetyl-CoA carboxylase biotin carboxylase subunit [Aggregatilineales bacterium]
MLKRCLVANRGEIAVRIIRACRALGIETVAVYSDVDASARHVSLADAAIALGGAVPSESYLHIDKLLAAAQAARCDCLHPGYGFLSESPDFAQAVLDAQLVWVGPPPEAIRRMGVKTEARTLMAAAGVPLVPGYEPAGEVVEDEAAFLAAAAAIGYPVLVKAAGGGGGKGIRQVNDPAELPAALAAARREADHAFGDPRVYLERFVTGGRHIEVQVLADMYGAVVHLFERDCSAQRRHQKVVEEAPAPGIDAALRARMGDAAIAAARAVDYVNAGTVEFIVTPQGDFYFLEMNTRLQVEHPITEAITGLDLVQLQFAVAAGEPLPFAQNDVHARGHAIECRLYAEDPTTGFLPAPGPLFHVLMPEGPGIRVDAGVSSGEAISPHYDPLIAKVIAWGQDRPAALARMAAALRELVIVGTTTNAAFLRALIDHPEFQAGGIDTHFIDRELHALLPVPTPLPDAVLVAAALDALERSETHDRERVNDPWDQPDSFRIGAS